MATIKNPIEWSWLQLRAGARHLGDVGGAVSGQDTQMLEGLRVQKLTLADLRASLQAGLQDFSACRSDVLFIALIYPLAGLLLVRTIFNEGLLPLLFPMISGFALIGPLAAVGLYEMSRRREKGLEATWSKAFSVFSSPSFGAIVILGFALIGIFIAWLACAQIVYTLTLGPEPPQSVEAFLEATFRTNGGRSMIVIGSLAGFGFALLVLAGSVVSFPLLLDRKVGVIVAVKTSLRVTLANPVVIGAWGLIVAGGLLLGALPAFLGLIFVMPILGHATWHLYRRAVSARMEP